MYYAVRFHQSLLKKNVIFLHRVTRQCVSLGSFRFIRTFGIILPVIPFARGRSGARITGIAKRNKRRKLRTQLRRIWLAGLEEMKSMQFH